MLLADRVHALMQDHFTVLEENDLVEHALDVSDQMGREQDGSVLAVVCENRV
mgnify:CR=1 FL=1